MIKTQGFKNNTNERHTMKQELLTTTANLKTVAQKVFSNSNKTIREEISDVAKLNVATQNHVVAELQKATNIKWTISEIQNKMKELVEYAPQDKEDRNPAFEMRVLASAEQIVLVLERVNPNAFGEYDSKGNWQDFSDVKTDENYANPRNTKSYNVKFNNTENGFDFNDKGELVIANRYIKPVIENEVRVSDNVKKTERFANQTPTLQTVSKALATGFFKRAYPQAKKSRATKPPTENEQIENATKLTKYVQDINIIYSDYVKSGGKSGNAERLLEKDAKILMTLKNDIDTMLSTRGNAEDLAFEIEQGQRKAG